MAHDESILRDYTHFVPEAKLVANWASTHKFELVDSQQKLDEVLVNPKYCSFDLETTGLDPTECFIVGVAMSMDGITGYYIPIRHHESVSLGKEALDKIYQFLTQCKQVFLFNVRFDFRFMKYAGYDVSQISYYEVAQSVNLADSNKKMPSLKWAERHFLGWEVQSFAEVLGGNVNLYYADPKDVVFYAATDALGTFNLVRVVHKFYREAGLSAKIENEFYYHLMEAECNHTNINIKALELASEQASQRITQLAQQIYKIVGYSFAIHSSQQLSDALKSLGIDTGEYTDKGFMRTGEEYLERVYAKEPHPVLPLLLEYKGLHKAHTSYFNPIIEQAKACKGALRFSYQTSNVPTGRLAGGKDAKNSFFANLNIQAVTKPHTQDYFCEYTGSNEPGALLGWEFTPAPKGWRDDPVNIGKKVIEGSKVEQNIRAAFEPDPDCYWVSIDYKGQEIRIPTILTGEPVWLRAFQNGEDVHKLTAIAIYGSARYNKDLRKMAKIGNFGILYGQNAWSFANKHSMPLEEAEAFVDSWWGALRILKGWRDRHVKMARKEGTVYTLFGRPRRVRWYFAHANPKVRSFGYRTAVNTVIQGTGADILKLGLIRVSKRLLLNPEFKDRVRFLSTIHDEINYSVKKESAVEIIQKLMEAMTIRLPRWPIGLEVDVSIGTSWGTLFGFRLVEGGLEPAYTINE